MQQAGVHGRGNSTLATALGVGGLVGAVFGFLDGCITWLGTTAEFGMAEGLGCLAAAVFQYVLLGFVVAAVA
jgi:hypothetical protein